MNKEKNDKWWDFFAIIFSLVGFYGGFKILLTGEMDAARTDSVFRFDGFEQLFGLIPIAVASLILAGVYYKYQKQKSAQVDNQSSEDNFK